MSWREGLDARREKGLVVKDNRAILLEAFVSVLLQDLIARLCVVDPIELSTRRSHVPESELFVSLDAQVLHHAEPFAASILLQRVLDTLV